MLEDDPHLQSWWHWSNSKTFSTQLSTTPGLFISLKNHGIFIMVMFTGTNVIVDHVWKIITLKYLITKQRLERNTAFFNFLDCEWVGVWGSYSSCTTELQQWCMKKLGRDPVLPLQQNLWYITLYLSLTPKHTHVKNKLFLTIIGPCCSA